ncbi:MAG: arylsulfatase [Verrucomicrobiales bacterium]|nr:arylsulfatase [Verrucomicrobiales bacterium]MCP5526473.1 arylsulfatase [Verrucomicrobiales bacterium]
MRALPRTRYAAARLIGWLGGLLVAGLTSGMAAEPASRPNIIFLLADDLGYGELGCFGQEKIRTPNVDRLAREGMRFTRHYAGNAVCAPSRCVLMTGMHPGHAWVRDNSEVQPEGQKPIPDGAVTLAELLQAHGYTTAAMGKWGLGPPGSSGDPLRQGFNHFYGYNCQRHAHNFYPTYLWDDDRRVALDNHEFPAHQKLPEGADPADPESYATYRGRDYAPDRIADAARRFIRDHRDRPFFLYFPTTVPHLALQVPEDSLREYQGHWPDPPYPGGHGYLPQFAPRAAYAAMVTRLDREIGTLINLVDELGLTERTIFVFTSDNGPTYDRLGGSDSGFFNSAPGMRGLKGSLYEGGIRVPLVVRWKGRVPAGVESDRLTGFEDWLPTLLDLAGLRESIPANTDGISLAPTLLGRWQPPRPFLYREFPSYGGQQAVWMGPWKGIRQNLRPRGDARPNHHIELYNVMDDLAESRDVGDAHPELVARLAALMREQHVPAPEFPFPALDQAPEAGR